MDAAGNRYLRWTETINGRPVERREVQWAQPYFFYTPEVVPSDWRMWLRKLRDTPPTPEELRR